MEERSREDGRNGKRGEKRRREEWRRGGERRERRRKKCDEGRRGEGMI